MKSVNALEVRQALGKILDRLDRDGEPIIVKKGREERAVLVPLKLFLERFVDKTVHEERLRLARQFLVQQRAKTRKGPPAEVLVRQLRGPLP
ncbi:MAG: type II toxin-antitoxin system Phd/YefM family antitoxin [Deltaproteobacteria bacterium]|nr:type II toxin-antitoxin system Phd/YefM family antitoxin [Deltaproteobacteria bacterium]